MKLVCKRVCYGKKSTPVEDREYRVLGAGSAAVGNRREWTEFAREHSFQAVEFVELDGTKETVRI